MIQFRPWMLCSVLALAGAGGAAAWAAGTKAFVQEEPRTMSRVFLFGEKGPAGQYSVQYGSPAWKPEYDTDFDKMTLGQRIRLGKDWWTTLETYCPLTFGTAPGATTEVAEGSWFLALERSAEGAWSLVVLDPAPIRKAKMDAFATAKVTGGTLVPMQYTAADEVEAGLKIRFVPVEGKPLDQTFEIRFGKHRLTTTVAPKL